MLLFERGLDFALFEIFEKKIEKSMQKGTPPIHVFGSKIDAGTHQDALIRPFYWIFEGSKKRRFFDVASGSQKIDKNRALGAPGSPSSLRVVVRVTISAAEGPRAAANYQRNR